MDARFGVWMPGSRLVPTSACGWPAFAQYRPSPEGGHKAWALIVLELAGDQIRGHEFLPGHRSSFPGSTFLGSSRVISSLRSRPGFFGGHR
jgi:hypothetical protein